MLPRIRNVVKHALSSQVLNIRSNALGWTTLRLVGADTAQEPAGTEAATRRSATLPGRYMQPSNKVDAGWRGNNDVRVKSPWLGR